jgi:pimeloyl-ACP methyl ester carboxylesterase
MIRLLRLATLVLGSLCLAAAFAQTDSTASAMLGLEPGQYSVGFQLVEAQDPSRRVEGATGTKTYARPIRAYLWYPSQRVSGERPMRMRRYATLAEEDVWPPELTGELRDVLKYSRRTLARSLGADGFTSLLQRPVVAVENAPALAGPFPLIVIGQGLYYESPIAFAAFAEYLAGRGFVVATSPLVGTGSPLVRIDMQDLETQVRDLEFVIGKARGLPFVSEEGLGVLGFDMGGMAGLILAMRNPDVDVFVSLSSGILYPHPSGLPSSSPHYDPLALRVPWLHANNAQLSMPPPGSSPEDSLFARAIHSNRYLLLSEGMGHVDFTSYALIEDRSPMFNYWQAATPEGATGNRALSEYVYHFFAAFLTQNAESLAFIAKDPGESLSGADMTIEHRAAVPTPIGYDELVSELVNGRTEDAIEDLRSLAAVEPDHLLLDQFYLERLSHSLLNTWGLAEEAVALLEFAVERYPDSVNARVLLGEGQIQLENYAAAIDVYDEVVDRYPDNAWGKFRRDWLRSR